MTLERELEDRPGSLPGRSVPTYVPEEWVSAFAALPRSRFLPDLVWAHDLATGRSEAIDRRSVPDAWLAAAASDIPIVTQWDDGQHTGTEAGRVPTSSSSMPSVVAAMLAALDARPGQRVLNLGTGTGWDTALLAYLLGDSAVTSVDADAQLVTLAVRRLMAAGCRPAVFCGDGLKGWKERAPYDRVLCSFGLRSLPWAWVEQTRPGGVIVAPFGTHYCNADALVRLVVQDGGRCASGPFLQGVEFMKARSQRLQWPASPEGGGVISLSTTTVTPPEAGQFDPYPFAVGLRLPSVTHAVQRHPDGSRTLWLYSLTVPAWSSVRLRDGESVHQVQQYGGRRLWDEFEAAHRWWEEAGRPGFSRLGLAVSPEGHRAWLDTPENCWAIA